jgi:pimeloyl-ACP methyl ester carboxylesterase
MVYQMLINVTSATTERAKKMIKKTTCKFPTFLVCGVHASPYLNRLSLTGDAMKKLYLAAFLLFSVLTLILGSPFPARSQFTWPPVCQQGSLPSDDPKNPEDHQLMVICIPPNWNGRLIIYARGFEPPQAPLALPIDELILEDGTFFPNFLLLQGFAFATSSFRKNGATIEQGAEDLNQLLEHFKSVAPQPPQKVYVAGASEGGLIVVRLLERYASQYDAGLALCAPLAGSPEQIKYIYDFRVVFDYFFPDVFTFPPNQPGEKPFGVVDVPENAYLFWDVYESRIITALQMDLPNLPKTTQLFKVTGAALANPVTSSITTALSLLFYSVFATNDQIATAGGIPFDNRSTTYTGSLDDSALNAEVERIKGDGRAGAYTHRFYRPIGNLRRPLVTLHNTLDPVVPFAHEEIYKDLVAQKHKSAFLTVMKVEGYGHCDFTAQEVFEAFTVMVQQGEAELVN